MQRFSLRRVNSRAWAARSCILLLTIVMASAQQPTPSPTPVRSKLETMFEANVKAEWEAFKNKDKKAYSNLLAEDFFAVEDDNQGQRVKYQAVAEIDRSVVSSYNLFALKVVPLNPDAALVTYELTIMFPPKAAVRFKRVLVSEIWIKRNGQWKERYYQETHVR